jgi:hypothetical protein
MNVGPPAALKSGRRQPTISIALPQDGSHGSSDDKPIEGYNLLTKLIRVNPAFQDGTKGGQRAGTVPSLIRSRCRMAASCARCAMPAT